MIRFRWTCPGATLPRDNESSCEREVTLAPGQSLPQGSSLSRVHVNRPLVIQKAKLLYMNKVVQIIKCTCNVFVDNFRNISTNWYRYQLVGEVMADMWSIKEMIQCATLGIPKGMKKCSFYFNCFLPWLFDQKSKYNFRGMQDKKPFKIILYVGRVTSLQSWKGSQKWNIHL